MLSELWNEITYPFLNSLVILDGTMNHNRYIDQLLTWVTPVFERNFIFVQDNVPAHTASKYTAFLEHSDVEVMDWPAPSPNINPFEHVWVNVCLD